MSVYWSLAHTKNEAGRNNCNTAGLYYRLTIFLHKYINYQCKYKLNAAKSYPGPGWSQYISLIYAVNNIALHLEFWCSVSDLI